jgi:hypothetical protein
MQRLLLPLSGRLLALLGFWGLGFFYSFFLLFLKLRLVVNEAIDKTRKKIIEETKNSRKYKR